jgi:cation transport ATPase
MAKTKEKAAPKTEKKGAAQKAEKKGAAQKAEKKVAAKTDEKTEQEKQAKHVEGIKKTLLSALLGIAGGVLSYYAPPYGILILLVVVYAQRLALPRIRIDTKEYRFTDWFFLVFMTFAFWFVSWTILLNPPA